MTEINVPAPNIPLLRKAVEWAEAEAVKPEHRREWDQGAWAEKSDCGTTYCIAGYTVAVALPQAAMVEDEYGYIELFVDGERASWGETAAGVLGITRDERLALFDGSNDIADVRNVAEEIAARAGERL